jgi:hypothetical protein
VTVQYTNQRTEIIEASGLSAPQILEKLESLSNEMDVSETLSKIGVAGVKLEVPARASSGSSRII